MDEAESNIVRGMCMSEIINGVGPDSPIATNEQGGMQSDLPYRCDLLDAESILRLAAVLKRGAERYTPNNWRKIDCNSHLNHALVHIFAYMAGDTQDDHLDHAFCRMMMAMATEKQNVSL
jgi:hypothetical protein